MTTTATKRRAPEQVTVVCAWKPCSKEFTGRRSQRFCSARCRLRAFTEARGTRRDWVKVASDLADALRECVVSGTLPKPIEAKASKALRSAMPYRGRVTKQSGKAGAA